ncbi:folylpolyglutamate synthase [Capronia coronata CBS 617.96]|uniref:Folylpolyglutamate synthase n=1 Tax=Capronia coronata CBS 617.96 TaxID=1182541 RepID=W9YTV2_9EURO|nr:folylpolyglutamate synthase [Capronia coronata CBS 617.96]EXJ95943.1 folylpolyglutamate synthase [Capronia coronata CBS 617.96]
MDSADTEQDAVASLNTLQSNFAIVDAIRKSGRKMNEQAIPEMKEWCRKIGYEPSQLNALRAIHIAGTKGKGSTAAFASSILMQFVGDGAKPLSKVGLYTSPHLRFVRERIQINGQPLSEDLFARYFFEVWDRLEDAAKAACQDPKASGAKPVYFRFLTLMAFHTYMSEKVDTAVIECGIGGAYDSTNIIEAPAVTGITSLGIDHVAMLGSTIGEIAWHKSGIMKKGVKCFTPSSQLPEAKRVMEQVSDDKGSVLEYVEIHPAIATGDIRLGLEADFQKTNASLALAIAKEWLQQQGLDSDPEFELKVRHGLERVRWPGRCETRHEPGIRWCIDGGHTLESVELAGKWFATQLVTATRQNDSPVPQQPRFLIFNQQTRDASALARALYNTLSTALQDMHPFTHAIFCTNTTFKETGFKPDLVSVNANSSEVEALKVQNDLAETWRQIDPSARVEVVRTIEEAVDTVRQYAEARHANTQEKYQEVVALVTGSLHLVGGFLEVLETANSNE